MRQAIVTKYLAPTNTRGSRVKATAAAGSITIPYDYAGNANSVHAKAAKALAEKFGWSGVYVAGGMPAEDGNVYVDATVSPPMGVDGEDYFVVRSGEA